MLWIVEYILEALFSSLTRNILLVFLQFTPPYVRMLLIVLFAKTQRPSIGNKKCVQKYKRQGKLFVLTWEQDSLLCHFTSLDWKFHWYYYCALKLFMSKLFAPKLFIVTMWTGIMHDITGNCLLQLSGISSRSVDRGGPSVHSWGPCSQ